MSPRDGVQVFETSFAFVREDARLADVRRIMAGEPSVQDVFVTKTGTPDEPVVGWVTNVTGTRASVA